MLKVLLVTGEPETTKSLSNCIEVYTQECEIIPVGDSARVFAEAETAAASGVPSLIVADMDILNDPVGVVRRLDERFPELKVILYAAIGSSELLQQCMRSDILDYMYKPLKQSEFLRCLQRALDHFRDIDKRRFEEEKISEAFEAERDSYAEMFLRAVLDGRVPNDAVADGLSYFKIDLDPDFCVFTVELDRYEHRHESLLLLFKIRQMIEENLRGGASPGMGFRIFPDGLNAITVVLSGRRRQQDIIAQCETMKEQIHARLDARVSIGVGSGYRSPEDIAASRREARAALGYRPAFGYNSVIPLKVAETFNSVGYAYPTDAENEFVDSVANGAYENAFDALKTVTNALGEDMPVSKIVADILHAIDRRAAERGVDIRIGENFRPSDISGIITPSGAYDYLKSAARDICSLIAEARAEADSSLVKRATDHMKTHYHENISAAEIAADLDTSLEYFERLFEEREHMDVYEYTARLRLDEAKSLMRRTMQDDEVIAVKVGYDGAKQFRSEFREYEGMSVRDFRAGRTAVELS